MLSGSRADPQASRGAALVRCAEREREPVGSLSDGGPEPDEQHLRVNPMTTSQPDCGAVAFHISRRIFGASDGRAMCAMAM